MNPGSIEKQLQAVLGGWEEHISDENFWRRVMDMNLTTIEAVNIDQDIFGQIFGYGRITVHGTGDDMWVTPLIANPVAFRRDLQAAMPSSKA